MKKKQESPKTISTKQKIVRIALISLGGISLFFAQSTLWVNNVIFDQQTFTEITTRELQTQESRDAIAQTVVDRAFEGRPVADRLIGDRAVTFVSGLLGSDLSEKVLTRAASSGYAYVTSPDRQDLAIDLSAIKEPLAGIISFAESRGREVSFNPSNIPDTVTLVESDDIPEVYSFIRILLISNFFLWLAALSTFAGYIFISKNDRIKRIYMVGLVIVITSIFGLLSGPFVPPAVSSFVGNIQLRGLVSDLTSAYLAPFISQMYLTLLLTGIVMLIVRFRWIFIRGWQAAYDAINKKVSKK